MRKSEEGSGVSLRMGFCFKKRKKDRVPFSFLFFFSLVECRGIEKEKKRTDGGKFNFGRFSIWRGGGKDLFVGFFSLKKNKFKSFFTKT